MSDGKIRGFLEPVIDRVTMCREDKSGGGMAPGEEEVIVVDGCEEVGAWLVGGVGSSGLEMTRGSWMGGMGGLGHDVADLVGKHEVGDGGDFVKR